MTFWDRFLEWAESNATAGESYQVVVIKTTRYLRLAMVALVVALGASILYEHAHTHPQGCWLESISAYYYTPVQLVFVGALFTIGISLIALKGSTEWEDVLLNFAGIFAPIVAFVPTPNVPKTCGSVLTDALNRDRNIANNMTALLVMTGLAFATLLILRLILRRWPPDDPASAEPAGEIAKRGFIAALLLYGVVWLVFEVWRGWFRDYAHPIAAITMFVFIFFVVLDNALTFHFTRKAQARQRSEVKPPHKVNRYLLVAIGMVLAVLVISASKVFWHYDYWTIWLEGSMILLFATFWVIQTQDLWRPGLREVAGTPRKS